MLILEIVFCNSSDMMKNPCHVLVKAADVRWLVVRPPQVYTIVGGFDGRNGWVQSKLQIKPAAVSSSRASGTVSSRGSTRRQLSA